MRDRPHVEPEHGCDDRQHGDRDERRRDRPGDARKPVDDGEAERDQPVGGVRHAREFRQLRQEDQDRERVDEAGHHRLRHEPHHAAELQEPGADLDDAHQDRRGEEVLHAVVPHDADHHDGRRGCRGRDHGRPPARERDHAGDDDRGIEPDLWVDPCDDRKADRLRDQRERDDDPRQDIRADVGEPLSVEA
jgi:hypothetical protein